MFRCATIQFKADHNHPEQNLPQVLNLCEQAKKQNVDVIVFPEMSLTGYLWESEQSIRPYAETSTGNSFQQISKFCLENQCYVIYGFAELGEDDQLYNAQSLVAPTGEKLATYRKVHLFDCDTLWAKSSNQGFITIETPLGNFGLGICMDLNFQDFVDFHIEEQTEFLFFSTNWLEEGEVVHDYWLSCLEGYEKTIFMANTYGYEMIGTVAVEYCGRSAIITNGQIIKSAAFIGNQILITSH